uniref:Pancreatic trypsin inhibitor n=1 Tax=Rhipicephalus appendiculatus TaxID=34631 RepID=A0A131YWC4_RHIAP
MMRLRIILVETPALMTLLIIGQITGEGLPSESPAPTCETPMEPFYEDINDDDVIPLYIYNKTSGLCKDTLIKKGRNTFTSLFSCVSQCRTGQGSPNCVGDPVGVANNSYAEIYKNMYSEPYNEPYEAFFYNVSSMQCQNYSAIGPEPYYDNVTNFFSLYETCEEECSGFNITTIYGNCSTN